METATGTDHKLLAMIDRLCHSIAFESPAQGDGRPDAEARESVIKELFDLTAQGRTSREIASLAESFGLMLVKLETREVRQKELIHVLQEKNAQLEQAKKRLNKQNRALKTSLREKYSPAHFVGQCSQMQQAKQMALSIAQRPINTLLQGASGTGKEVFAKLIHYNSPRAENPFVAINCTAIPDTLFESEMFGIEKGVATGVDRRQGYFEQAHTGTIFLDEIGDMSLVNQAKLLRVVEENKLLRVGGTRPVPLDVKIISATHSDLKSAVDQGRFRQDLYYRLNVVELPLPLLKERGEDILILAEKLLAKNCAGLGRPGLSLSPEARQCLLAYDWPGNVRELNNEMERAAALTLSDRVEAGDLSAKLMAICTGLDTGTDPACSSSLFDRDLPPEAFNLEQIKYQAILKALEHTGQNRSRAAALLGITREGLRKNLIKIKEIQDKNKSA